MSTKSSFQRTAARKRAASLAWQQMRERAAKKRQASEETAASEAQHFSIVRKTGAWIGLTTIAALFAAAAFQSSAPKQPLQPNAGLAEHVKCTPVFPCIMPLRENSSPVYIKPAP